MRYNRSDKRLESAGRLKELRLDRKMSQEKFAEMLNISVSAYKKMESGENNISIANLRLLHDRLGASADYLLFGRSSDFEQIWNHISSSPETVKLKVLLRLLYYFGSRKGGGYDREKHGDIEQIITKLLDSIPEDDNA